MTYNRKNYSPPVLKHIIQEHMEGYAFLCMQKSQLIFSHEINRDNFSSHDVRIEAHWDGILTGGSESAVMAVERLDEFDPWDVFAAVKIWIEIAGPEHETIFEKISEADEEYIHSWYEAFRRIPETTIAEICRVGLTSGLPPTTLSVVLYAAGWHNIIPVDDYNAFIRSDEVEIRYRAARAIGWQNFDSKQAAIILEPLFNDDHAKVRRAALWSLVLTDPIQAASKCRSQIRSGDPDFFTFRVLGLIGRLDDIDLILQDSLTDSMKLARIEALGYLGNILAVDPLIEQLHLDDISIDLAVAVCKSIKMLLGELKLPEVTIRVPLSENESDFDEVKLPEISAVVAWWDEHKNGFNRSRKYYRGRTTGDGIPWDISNEAVWRYSLINKTNDELKWLRREIPAGFFENHDEYEALPGE